VGTGTGDSWIYVFLSHQGGPIKSSKYHDTEKLFYILCPKAFQSYNWAFTSFPALGLLVVPVETWTEDSRISYSLSN
jgi:hypothetical protein